MPVLSELALAATLVKLQNEARADRHRADVSREMVGLLNTAMTAHLERTQLLYLSTAGGLNISPKKLSELANKSARAIEKAEGLALANSQECALFIRINKLLRSVFTGVTRVNNSYVAGDKMQAAHDWTSMQNRIDELMDLSDQL